MSGFVHLRSHSQYSILDGLMSPKTLVSLAASDNQPAVALTDLHRMFGNVEFYEAAEQKGVKPIVGADIFIEADLTQPTAGVDETPEVYSRILLLAKTNDGYRRLMDLISRSYLENQVKGVARIKQSWLKESTEGLVALSGGEEGEIAQALLGNLPNNDAKSIADQYKSWFRGDFYLEVQRAGLPNEDQLVPALVDLSASTQIPLIATHPIQYEKADDFLAHEAKYCVVNSKQVYDLSRDREFTSEQYFQTEEQMRARFSDIPEAIDNAIALSQKCSITIELGKNYLPRFPTPNGESEDDYFAQLCQEGLDRRLESLYPDVNVREEKRPTYEARLKSEVETIIKMGFPGYYLIVADFINWAKDHGIPVGPGRGSGAGSLAAYSIGITDLDPLPYDLLFERFLNPERVSMPDFDIDFCEDRRSEVIDYVRTRYGDASVARISTYNFLKAKAALGGAGRALGHSFGMIQELSKMINLKPGSEASLLDILGETDFSQEHPEVVSTKLIDRYMRLPEVRELIDIAKAIESAPQAVGIHAGGVVISPGAMSDFSPLYLNDIEKGSQTQYDKDAVERAGLVKFDFLSLGTLTMVDRALQLINQREERQNDPLKYSDIPMEDQDTYKMLGTGDTIGVFQFESGGMQGYMKKLQPQRFEDLIALAALYRPGPLGSGMVDSFIERRHGREEVIYPHELLEKILEPTYGVIVYQEQVMQIAQAMAGYSLGGADLLRRAMGKKDAAKMAKERSKFEEGAVKNGVDAKKATEIFDLMEKFAEYGFNKSHSAAYALVAYQTAWLKRHYPAEFYAAHMNVSRDKTEKLAQFVDDAHRHRIKILQPDVNSGFGDFTTEGDALRYGFAGLKGVGDAAGRQIVQTRIREGKFESLKDFCQKMSGKGVNKGTIESLIQAGSFDSIDPNRAQLLEALPLWLKYISAVAKAEAKAKPGEAGPLLPGLFKGTAAPAKKKSTRTPKPILEPEIPVIAPWSEIQKLKEEQSVLGFFLSGHPYQAYAKQLDGLSAALPLNHVDQTEPHRWATHLLAGVVTSIVEKTDRNRRKYARLLLDDGSSSREITAFSSSWSGDNPMAGKIKIGDFVAIEAKIAEDTYRGEGVNQVLVEKFFSMEELQNMLSNQINIAMKKEDLPKLEAILVNHNDNQGLPISVYMADGDDRYFRAQIKTAKLAKTPAALKAVKEAFGQDQVKYGFTRKFQFENKPKNRGPRP